MTSNTDARAASFLARLIQLEDERREYAEDRRELTKEMAGAGLSKDEIAGIKLAVKRHYESEEARAKRVSVEEFAESLGSLRELPLGQAALARVA